MNRAALALLLILLAGCGFHPAGSRALPEPLQRVRIDLVAPYEVSEPPVETALRTRLLRRGAKVVEKKEDDITVIRLYDLRASREVLSVGADGKALEYELILRVRFDARTGGNVWLPPDQLEVRRDYSFSARQILPKEQEADRLREFLEGELAELLLLRIEAAAQRAPAQGAGVPAAAPDAVPAAPAPPPG